MTGQDMVEEKFFPKTIGLDGRWILVAYCFLVVFVLLPTFLVTRETIAVTDASSARLTVWLLSGVSAIAFLVGVVARQFTVVEPGLATFLFLLTLIFELDWGRGGGHLPLAVRSLAELIMWGLWSIFLALACAMIGRWVRLRMRRTMDGSSVA